MGPERRGDTFQLDQVKGMERADMSRKLQRITGQSWTPRPLLRQTCTEPHGVHDKPYIQLDCYSKLTQ